MNDLLLNSLSDLKHRNNNQTLPYNDICNAYTKMFNEKKCLERQIYDLRKQIVLIQRETADLISTGDTSSIADTIRLRLQKIYDDLKERQEEEVIKKISADLGRKVSEQNKLILDIQEEIRIYKSELIVHRENIAILTAELETSRKSELIIAKELGEIRTKMFDSENRIRTLEIENAALLDRMLSEKERIATELNKMNYKVDNAKATSSYLLSSAMNMFSSGKEILNELRQSDSVHEDYGTDNFSATSTFKQRSKSVSGVSNLRVIDQDYVSVVEDAWNNTQSLGLPTAAWKSFSINSFPTEINGIIFINTIF